MEDLECQMHELGFYTVCVVIKVFGKGVTNDNPGRGVEHRPKEGESGKKDRQR